MKKRMLIFWMLAVLLTGCAGRGISETVPVSIPEETASAEAELPVFARVFLPVAGNPERTSMDAFKALLNREELRISEEEGIATVPEAGREGSYVYAVLTNENGIVEIAQLGYHYKAADGEYEVLADWSEAAPRYLTDVTGPDSGREVASLAAVESYIAEAALSIDRGGDAEAAVGEFADRQPNG